MSWVLRHRPDAVDLQLDAEGWTDVERLLAAAERNGTPMTRDELLIVVETNDKRRFAVSADGSRIRANQGRSIDIELGYPASAPPELLFHGTAARFADAILRDGRSGSPTRAAPVSRAGLGGRENVGWVKSFVDEGDGWAAKYRGRASP